MTNSIGQETGAAPAPRAEKPKAGKKARVAAKHAPGAPRKAKSAPNPKAPKRAHKGAQKATAARDGSKAAKVLDLLKRPEGASMKELLKATGWQAHSLRGFLSGTIREKLGLTLTSAKMEGGERTYSVKG